MDQNDRPDGDASINNQPNEGWRDDLNTDNVESPPVYQRTGDGQYAVKPSLIERLLSPQSLQWMMTVGGGMLVVGFVVWLWSIGLFANPMVVAVSIGGGVAALIGLGIAVVKFTRYRLAGTGLTLLGAMAMPLQLWFYHAQGLIDLNAGGHLWIPAAVFCLVYAGIARVLRNPAFVYTLVGGVVLTGMLFLADQAIGQFWNLLPQVAFLVALGWGSLFAEKWFVESDSEFSRAKFGIAFRKSGIVVIVSGLFLLLGSQVAGVFFNEIAINGYLFPQYIPSPVQQCWALAILGLTAIGVSVDNGLSSFSNRRKMILVALGVWIAICLIGLLNVTITFSGIATVAAATVLILNLVSMTNRDTNSPSTSDSASHSDSGTLSLRSGDLGPLKIVIAFSLCVVALFHAATLLTGGIDYAFFAQIALASFAAISCALVVRLQPVGSTQRSETAVNNSDSNGDANRDSVSVIMAVLGGVTGAVTLWAAATLLAVATTIPSVFVFANVGLMIPLALAAGGLLLRGEFRRVTKHTASAMTVSSVMLLAAMATTQALGDQAELVWLGVTLVAALIHYLCSYLTRSQHATVRIGLNRFASYGYLIAAIAISMTLAGVGAPMAIVSSPAVVGLLLIVIGTTAIASGVKMTDKSKISLADERRNQQWNLVQDYGRIFVMFANTAAILWALNNISVSMTSTYLAAAIAIQLAAAIVGCLLSKSEGWKHGFTASAILLVITECLVVHDVLPLSTPTKVELVAVLVGVMLLGIGHLGWARENDSHTASTTAALWFGSLMTAGPLMVALFCHRYFYDASTTAQFSHEVAVLATLLILTAAGILCRIRSTTIIGAAGMTVYIGSLLTMIPLPEKLQSISVLMMAGGAIFFTAAILLSVYRDRIIAIPQRYRQGDGLFQVLKWR